MKVIQSGPRDARLVIVGEAPGANEEAQGVPFVGGSGQMLDQLLAKVGISRSDVFVTNVCHKQPPHNNFAWFLTKAGQAHLIPGILQLKKDLEEIKPNLILCMGGQALRIVAGKEPITDWRGSIVPCTLVPGLKVIGTIHPAAALRIYEQKTLIQLDMKRARVEMLTPGINYPKRTFYLPGHKVCRRVGTQWVTTDESYNVDEIITEMLHVPELSVDIECSQDSNGAWHLTLCAFSDRCERSLVLATNDLMRIALLCATPSLKIMQNGMFDWAFLRDMGIKCGGTMWDTMVAHQTLLAESAGGGDEISTMISGKKKTAIFKKGLGFQVAMYTREPYYKDDGKVWKNQGDPVVFQRYNALDAAVTLEIKQVQEKELTEVGLLEPFLTTMPLIFPIMRATEKGILIDENVRSRLRLETETKCTNFQSAVDIAAGESINVKSSPQVAVLLYEKLKLPPQYKRRANGTRTVTADKDALTTLSHISHNPILHLIIQVRQQRDLLERYFNVPLDSDGRMRCSFDMTGTKSYRLSSRASLSGSGTNLQNQPEFIRSMYVADPGHVFIYRDYSQAEARVVAYQARCRGLIELFEDPSRDIHTENAARIFGCHEAKLEKHGGPVTAIQRYLAKRVVHACNYGMEAKRLVEIVNEDAPHTGVRINLREAKGLIDKYFLLYSEIPNVFWREVEQNIRHTRTLINPWGFKRTFFGRVDDKLFRDAYSWVPQSTVGILGRLAWINIQNALDAFPDYNALALLNVHDSILVQCRDEVDTIAHVTKLMEAAMDIPMTLDGQTFRIPTDCKVGYNWGNADEKNPRGLKEYP